MIWLVAVLIGIRLDVTYTTASVTAKADISWG
jgi:hypothetical protein